MQKLTKMISLVALLAQASTSQAQFGNTYVAVNMHLDQVMQPKDGFNVASDCTNSAICSSALSAISAASGYPIDKVVAVAALFSTSNFGEGNGFNVNLPSGYRYCTSNFRLTSIVPHDGDRGSRILLRADDNGLYAETWTPVLGPGEGRSWVEGDVTVVGVRSDLAASAYSGATPCRAGNSRPFFWCRGSGCEGSISDTGRAISMVGVPGAGERWQ